MVIFCQEFFASVFIRDICAYALGFLFYDVFCFVLESPEFCPHFFLDDFFLALSISSMKTNPSLNYFFHVNFFIVFCFYNFCDCLLLLVFPKSHSDGAWYNHFYKSSYAGYFIGSFYLKT